MPKLRLEFTAKEWLDKNKFSDIDSAVELIMEYAPDHGFPDNTDCDTIQFDETSYTPQGNIVLTFSYDLEEEEEEEEDDDSQDPDGSEGEDL